MGRPCMYDKSVDFGEIYDAIIAGAGPAGCVLASRLSEHADKTILLLEAGPDSMPGTEHPDILDPFPTSSDNPAFHWPGLTAEADADASGSNVRRRYPYVKGYGVGGGSNINGMAVDRGLPDDYNEWQAFGADGWDWESVLPYFKKLECDLDFPGSGSGSMHGANGPMPVRRLARSRWAPFTAAIGEAVERRGFGFIEDYTADFRDGLSSVPTNSLLKGRVSASMAYLAPEVRMRPNLKILANARVDRISMDGLRAEGVFICVDGTTAHVRGRQVIVCCGALQSPALLLRSGIGPSEQLRRFGIKVVRDIHGVGANLQNHPCVSLTVYLPHQAVQPEDNPWFLQNWLRFSSNQPECGHGDMHLMQFNKTAWHALGKRVGMIAVSVLQPYSRGCVELSNPDPGTPPRVRFNLLADARDGERLTAGLRFTLGLLTDPNVRAMRHELFLRYSGIAASLARRNRWNGFKARTIARILDCTPIRRVLLANARVDPEVLLEEEVALREFVRRRAHPQAHDCGTCRMGQAKNSDAVVDAAGRVHGMEALRVVDASIFPTIPRGYPHFVVLMVAEKIASAINLEWRGAG